MIRAVLAGCCIIIPVMRRNSMSCSAFFLAMAALRTMRLPFADAFGSEVRGVARPRPRGCKCGLFSTFVWASMASPSMILIRVVEDSVLTRSHAKAS